MSEPTLDIILVNRNSGTLLGRCLRSIAAADLTGFRLTRVCVVDDCSTDGSLDALPAGLPLEVVRNPRRLGYGASCNRGASGSRAEWLLFLNTDIELESSSLTVAMAFAAKRQEMGAGMLGIQLVETDGSVARSCSRFPTVGTFLAMMVGLDKLLPGRFANVQMKDWDHRTSREVDQVMGAFLLMPRALFDRLGGYDERFFVYMEDLDLALRARALGAHNYYLAEARAVHLGGGTARQVWAESLFFAARSRLQFAFKHWGALRGVMLALGTLLVEPWARAVHYLRAGSAADVRATFAAYGRLWGWVLSGAPAPRQGRETV